MTETTNPPATKSPNRRRKLVVDKKAQGNLILSISLVPAVALSIATVLISVFCYRLQQEAVLANVELPSLTPLLLTLFGFVVVSSLFIMLNAMRISHRVSGPAHNICTALRRIRSGELDFTLVLREGDQLEGLEDEVNRTLAWLREHPPTGVEGAPTAAATAAPTVAPTMAKATAAGRTD